MSSAFVGSLAKSGGVSACMFAENIMTPAVSLGRAVLSAVQP